MKRVLIVEDNQKAAVSLQKILKEINGSLEITVASCLNAAKQALTKGTFDLFVVDIILNSSDSGDASGLYFIEYIRGFRQYEFTPVVITTSVAEMKEHAYDHLDCYKYLEKPYDSERAKKVLTKALSMPLQQDSSDYIYIKSDGVVHAVEWRTIVTVRYDDRKITIQMTNGTLCAYYKSLKEIYDKLPDKYFVRCNKGTVINKAFVEAVDLKKNEIHLKKPFESAKIGISYRKKVIGELIDE